MSDALQVMYNALQVETASENLQAQQSDPTADIEENNSESDAESEFELIVPQAEIAESTEDLSAPQEEDGDEVESLQSEDDFQLSYEVESLHSEDDFQLIDMESVASAESPVANPSSEAEVADESARSEAGTQLDKSDYTATCDSDGIPEANLTSEVDAPSEESAASADVAEEPVVLSDSERPLEAELELEADVDSCDGDTVQLDEPEARPTGAAKVGSTARARRQRSMAPAEVTRFADAMAHNASCGLAEALRLINCVDARLNNARPHVADGATYFTQQVRDDYHSTAKDMKDAFGEGQESEPTVAASFSHFKSQVKNDFTNIRKEVDSAFGSVLAPDEAAALNEFKAIPAATCSIVSMAVAAWLVPVRLTRFAAANIAM